MNQIQFIEDISPILPIQTILQLNKQNKILLAQSFYYKQNFEAQFISPL